VHDVFNKNKCYHPDDNIDVITQSYFNHIIQPDDNIHVIIQPDDNIYVIIQQRWARAFFKASHLRFRAPGGSSSRSFFSLKFRAFAFALSRSRTPRFFALFFALLNFSRSFSRSSIFSARNFVLVRLFTARTEPG
jgi:hypothetical protein